MLCASCWVSERGQEQETRHVMARALGPGWATLFACQANTNESYLYRDEAVRGHLSKWSGCIVRFCWLELGSGLIVQVGEAAKDCWLSIWERLSQCLIKDAVRHEWVD